MKEKFLTFNLVFYYVKTERPLTCSISSVQILFYCQLPVYHPHSLARQLYFVLFMG